MCLAIPSKITKIENNMAVIDVDGVMIVRMIRPAVDDDKKIFTSAIIFSFQFVCSIHAPDLI